MPRNALGGAESQAGPLSPLGNMSRWRKTDNIRCSGSQKTPRMCRKWNGRQGQRVATRGGGNNADKVVPGIPAEQGICDLSE